MCRTDFKNMTLVHFLLFLFIHHVYSDFTGRIGQFKPPQSTPFGIVNGNRVSIKQHPYLVSLIRCKNIFQGSGIILNKYWILTAAYNLLGRDPKDFSIRVGSTWSKKGGVLHDPIKFFRHENYTGQWDFDIALIKLKKKLRYSKYVWPLYLSHELPKNNTESVVSGWGYNPTAPNDNVLNEGVVRYIDYNSCKPHLHDPDFTKYSFCTFPHNGAAPCALDYGNPLVYKNKLIGVFSGSYSCGGSKYPAVYTDATKFCKWIWFTIKHNTSPEEIMELGPKERRQLLYLQEDDENMLTA